MSLTRSLKKTSSNKHEEKSYNAVDVHAPRWSRPVADLALDALLKPANFDASCPSMSRPVPWSGSLRESETSSSGRSATSLRPSAAASLSLPAPWSAGSMAGPWRKTPRSLKRASTCQQKGDRDGRLAASAAHPSVHALSTSVCTWRACSKCGSPCSTSEQQRGALGGLNRNAKWLSLGRSRTFPTPDMMDETSMPEHATINLRCSSAT